MIVKQIKIDFFVTPEIKRYVYVYFVGMENGCILIDSGVAGSESIIEKTITENGYLPSDIKAVFLTHAHPDHIGTADYFRGKYGAKIYASKGEQPWIENIDLQFKKRPIPNFYQVAGQSTIVDHDVKDGDIIYLSGDVNITVIGTPGHSVDGVSYRIEDVVFVGDAVPVRGDIPIFVNLVHTKQSLDTLKKLTGVKIYYPAWDITYPAELMEIKIAEGKEIVNELERTVCELDDGMELSVLVQMVCDCLHKPMWKSNPLFAKTVACCRSKK